MRKDNISIGEMLFPGAEIAVEKDRLEKYPELFFESRPDLPVVDFRLNEPKLLIKGDLTSHSLEIRRAFGLQFLAATELVKERFGETGFSELECTLDLPYIASFFEALISHIIQILASWAFQEGIRLKFVCQPYPEPEIDTAKIKAYVSEAWNDYKKATNCAPERESLVTVNDVATLNRTLFLTEQPKRRCSHERNKNQNSLYR